MSFLTPTHLLPSPFSLLHLTPSSFLNLSLYISTSFYTAVSISGDDRNGHGERRVVTERDTEMRESKRSHTILLLSVLMIS